MWGQGENGRDGVGGTLLTWFLNHVLIYPILPGHQADLSCKHWGWGRGGAELRMEEPTVSSEN